MSELPKPAFVTDEEIVAGGKAIAEAGDTTVDRVGEAVRLGKLILDTELANVRYLIQDGSLLYHIFRGEAVPGKFWDAGEYGLVVLSRAETYWTMDKPRVEFHADVCRPEVYEDNPRESSKYPPHFYGAYLVIVPGLDRKLSVSEDKIKNMVACLDDELKMCIAGWSNVG